MRDILLTAVFTVAYFIVTLLQMRGYRITVHDIAIGGIAIALSLILESIRIPLPFGTSIPILSMVPLCLVAIVLDYRTAIIAGAVAGLLSMFLIPEAFVVHWLQVPVEHLISFSCLGYTAVFGKDSKKKLVFGFLLASAIMTVSHILSGVVFFSQFAWDGWGPWGYSVVYNLAQNLPLILMSGIMLFLLPLDTLRRRFGGKTAVWKRTQAQQGPLDQ